MLCDHLEWWDREGGREGDARGERFGNICICITDSLCYKAETNIVKQLYSNKDVKNQKQQQKKASGRDAGHTRSSPAPRRPWHAGCAPGLEAEVGAVSPRRPAG